MQLILDEILNDSKVVSAIINKIKQTEVDTIYWKRYLKFEETKSRLFKTYLGTGVTVGSIIDRNSRKPLIEPKTLGSGIGEVAFMGNSFKLDNDRLDTINHLIKKFNGSGSGQGAVMNEIINYLADDIRQAILAPHKDMDYVLGQLRSTGRFDYKGIKMELPVIRKELFPMSEDILTKIQKVIEEFRPIVGRMEMTRTTFNSRIANSKAFQNVLMGSSEIPISGGLITDSMASQLLVGLGLPPIRIVEEYVTTENGTSINTFADDRISLLPSDDLGKMMYHTPYEVTNPIPNKVYTHLEGGHFISSQRTEEGRFIEYGAEWIPNIQNPNKIAIIDTSKLG